VSKPRSVLFSRLRSFRDSVAALRRVASGWSAIRTFQLETTGMVRRLNPLEGVEVSTGGVPWRFAQLVSI